MALPIQYDHVRQPAATLTISITLGGGMRSPAEVRMAIDDAMYTYASTPTDEATPFSQQPGFPQGQIKNGYGVIVGTWEVKGLTP